MTDNEIIKALECCTNKEKRYCKDCPLKGELPCVNLLANEALDLINRQQAEIEGLKIAYDEFGERFAYILNNNRKKIKTAKAEAIKEFAERFKQEINLPLAAMKVFNNLVKEMVGDAE